MTVRARAIRSLAGALVSLAGVSPVAAQPRPPLVTTDAGVLRGLIEDGQQVFKGIPFAAPPVGRLRWRAPQPAPAWAGTRDATRFGTICMQPPARKGAPAGEPESEDCLFLNVFRPAGDAKGLPVLFWIPGGGLVSGSGSREEYDGKALARRGAVVVTINYRLGRFGFFAHPELTAADPDGGRLYNYGLMDQIAALQWVKRNIAAFGGEPSKVTIFGESAGGASVDALMISPEARGLFAAAISESGYGRGSFPRISERSADGDAPANSIGLRIAMKLGMPAATLAQLRAVPATRLVALFDRNEEHIFAVDGKTLTSDMWTAFAHRLEAPVPFIVGSNSFEMGAMDANEARPWAEMVVPADRWGELTPFYPSIDVRNHLLLSDILFTSQVRAIATRHAYNGFPTWVYRFDVPTMQAAVLRPGAAHAAEIPYVFGNLAVGDHAVVNRDAADTQVSDEMMSYWLNMARHGDPNGAGLPAWPLYADHILLRLGKDRAGAVADPLTGRLDTLDRVAIDTVKE